MKVLIIEDEINSSKKLASYVNELRPDWSIIGILGGIKESILFLEEGQEPDLIFLDVQLSDGESFTIFVKNEY